MYLPFRRFDESEIWQIHSLYFQTIGIKAWQRGQIPYSGVSNFTEAYKKARLFVDNLKLQKQPESIRILEIGAGYGEFARNFLSALQEICKAENLDFWSGLEYHLSDFSQTTLDQLKDSGRLDEFADKFHYKVFDALDKYSELDPESYDLIMANYLLDQFPARIFARVKNNYYEKYFSIEDPQPYLEKQKSKSFWFWRNQWIKRLRKCYEFREFDWQSLPLDHRDILETCFRSGRDSSLVYSYGSLAALKNFLRLLKPTGLIVCSDFNMSAKPGFDECEPCYYGNSVAQAVNFEFLYKYFSAADESKHLKDEPGSYQVALVYEDPIKPLHTLILTRPDYGYSLELGEIYQAVYHQNWLLRFLYRYLAELQLASYILALFMFLFCLFGLSGVEWFRNTVE